MDEKIKIWFYIGIITTVLVWTGVLLIPKGETKFNYKNQSIKSHPSSELIRNLQNRQQFSGASLLVLILLILGVIINFYEETSFPSHDKTENTPFEFGLTVFAGLFVWLSCAIGSSSLFTSFASQSSISQFQFLAYATAGLQFTLLISGISVLSLGSNVFENAIDRFTIIKDSLRGIKLYLRVYPIIFLTILLNYLLQELINLSSGLPGGILFYRSVESPLQMVILIIMIGFLAPLAEEVFFRGVFYNNLKTWLSPTHAALISSALFAFVHFQPSTVFPLWILGIILALVYERTKSLTVIISMHSMQNFTSLLLISLV